VPLMTTRIQGPKHVPYISSQGLTRVYRARCEPIQEDKQCTFQATLRRVRVTIVAVKKQQILHILSVRL
jgi:hypothetical protein